MLKVAVSCVEAGRWDGAPHDESFVPAPQTANPSLRRMKKTQASASLAAGMEARAVQGEVWREVADTAPTTPPPSIDDARNFDDLLLGAPCTPGPAVGMGRVWGSHSVGLPVLA